MLRMIIRALLAVVLMLAGLRAGELPSKKYLNLAAVKTIAAAAEAEAEKRGVNVTICIVDDSGGLLFLQRGDGARVTTIEFAQKKARHAAVYGRPSKTAEDQVKGGDVQVLAYPEAFPNQGGVPIIVDGQLLGGVAASGAPSQVDEAIALAAAAAIAPARR